MFRLLGRNLFLHVTVWGRSRQIFSIAVVVLHVYYSESFKNLLDSRGLGLDSVGVPLPPRTNPSLTLSPTRLVCWCVRTFTAQKCHNACLTVVRSGILKLIPALVVRALLVTWAFSLRPSLWHVLGLVPCVARMGHAKKVQKFGRKNLSWKSHMGVLGLDGRWMRYKGMDRIGCSGGFLKIRQWLFLFYKFLDHLSSLSFALRN